MAEQGWRLTVVARDPDRLAAAFASVDPGQIDRVAVDLAAPDAADAVVDAYKGKNLSLDALILAAGVGSAAPLDGYSMGRFDKQFALNTRAPFVLVSQLLPLLREGEGGRVIALASIAGVHAEQSLGAYGASKAALLALCRGINVEESARGVSATAIAPGYVDTDMSAWVHDTVPPETMIPVDDVVRTVMAILSLSPRSVIDEIVMRRATAVGHHA
ncbi:SDR family NAD(P)-dependent oxidoreductase [Actinoplanes sp. TRM 88003]|uniref:SDR family NAD(P)-dependent oxidoreductase n=1 Tax=Paractinoplanes aksuensis TaxID=2939490 RepID=A0ABT1DTX0_9ACTN|nr:SDR family NAD(P)-dependent oxidoreductase [Actinoplanes aksuensis]